MQFAQLTSCISHCMAQVSVRARHSIFMLSVSSCPFVIRLFVFVLLLFLSVVYLFASTFSLHSDLHSFFHDNSAKGNNRCFFGQRGVLPPLSIFHPPTSYEPNVLHDFHDSETSEIIFQGESGNKDTEPSYSCDAELDDEIIGKAPSSPLFIQEREEPANRRQAYHSGEESLLPAQSFFHTNKYGETSVRT